MKSRKIQAIIALLLVIGFLGLAAYQIVVSKTLDADLKGALIVAFATAYGYYLGSSDSSARKGDALEPQPPKE